MTESEDLRRKKKACKTIRVICAVIATMVFITMLVSCNHEMSVDGSLSNPFALFVVGFALMVGGSLVKSAQRKAEDGIAQLWKDSIDHTPGTETAQCTACFGPVFADALRCRHCGASFVDEGPTIIPFIGVGF